MTPRIFTHAAVFAQTSTAVLSSFSIISFIRGGLSAPRVCVWGGRGGVNIQVTVDPGLPNKTHVWGSLWSEDSFTVGAL